MLIKLSLFSEEEWNMTLSEWDSFDLNLTETESNSNWTADAGTTSPTTTTPPPAPPPRAGALIGHLTTRSPVLTSVRPDNYSLRPFLRPHYHQGPRFGPYFEDGVESVNLTARVGTTVRLDCKIGMLQDKTVSF